MVTRPPSSLSRRFEHATVPVAKLSLSGDLLLVNEALSKLLGVPAGALVGRQVAELVDRVDDVAAVTGALAAARSGLLGGDFSQVWRSQDGTRQIHVRVAWTTTLDAEADMTYLTAICIDESERVEAERRALSSEARWRAMLVNAADVIWSAAADGTLLFATDRVLDQLGWERHEIVGSRLFDFVHGEDMVALRGAWERLVSGSSRQEVLECRVLSAGGGWTWMQQTMTDLRDDPHVGALVGNAVDITQRREVEGERARYEERFRARFERSHLPQSMLDVEGRLTDVNEAFCRMLSRPREQLIGLPVAELMHDSDERGGTAEELLALLRGEVAILEIERILRGPSGRPVPVMLDVTLLRNPDGEPDGAAVFMRDLSSVHDAERRWRQQEDFFIALNQRASDFSMVADAEGHILYVSPAVGPMLGYEQSDLLAELGWDFIHPDDLADVARVQQQVVARGGSGHAAMRIRAADGTWRWMEGAITNMVNTPVGGLVSNLRDITAEVDAREALRASETRYRAIVNTAQEGIWATAPDGSTLYANSRLATMLGVTLADLYDRPADVRRILLGSADGAVLPLVSREATRIELPYRGPDGIERTLWVASSALHTDEGTSLGSLVMASDITDARRLEQQLRHAALHDSLTNLPNRALLLDRLDRALMQEGHRTAVLSIDLDQFKLVNDSRGHAVGDDVLVAVAQRLTQTLRPRDTVARFGGDEFVVICEDVDEELAHSLAEEVGASLREPLAVRGGVLHTSASIGLAISPARSGEDLLRFADTAMYAAKAAGRRRVRMFDPSMSKQADDRYALSVDLRAALGSDTLIMHYQPIIDLVSGAVRGVEGLARWDHPVRGSVPPASFVPVGEDMGLAPELDRWAIRSVIRDAAALHAQGALPPDAYVAVNLSACNLADTDLEPFILSCTEQYGLAPELVVLEVTESAIMDDTALAVALLGRLRESGFGIAVDDFGTGYSSLAYLRDLPITSLKIDRSFVRDIVQDKDALAIVTSIVDLARAVNVNVVAEGVETRTQAQLLVTLGCSTAQGWLWSHAEPAAEHVRSGSLIQLHDVRAPDVPVRRSRLSTSAQVGAEHGLQELLELHRSGASLSTIAAALNREGFTTPAGTRWHRNVVARVISDRLVSARTAATPDDLDDHSSSASRSER